MAASYRIIPALRLKYVRVTGKTHLNELRELASRYFDDPQFSAENRFLVDLTDLTGAQAKFMDVFTLKAFYEKNFGDLEYPIDAAIVTTSKLGFGISRMFATLMAGKRVMRVRIFTNMAGAAEWLRVDCREIQKLQKQFVCP